MTQDFRNSLGPRPFGRGFSHPKMSYINTPEGTVYGYILNSVPDRKGREIITIVNNKAEFAHFYEDECVGFHD